jgi:hypothetical protein
MPALASVDDIQARYPGNLAADALTRIAALLDDASAVVRSYTRQQFTQSQTTTRIRPVGHKVILAQRPVTSVDTVSLVDSLQPGGLIALPVGSWMWDGGAELWIGGLDVVVNLPDEVTQLLRYEIPLIEVTYTHGYAEVPADVVSVVCSMVARVIDIPGPVGMQYQTVGPFGYRLSATAQEGILSLTPSEQRVLDVYRRKTRTVELR